jgi:hypothetical protein
MFAAFLVLGAVLPPRDAGAQEPHPGAPIDIVIDKAQLMRLPERVATIVIGNPLIADASLQTGGLMVLTGKGYGATNLVALDRKGQVLLEKTVQVLGPEQDIVVYKGVNRETYSCTPECQPRIMLGDGMQYFSQTMAQTMTRSTQATATNSR